MNPGMVLDRHFIGSKKLRLNTLVGFLESMPDDKTTVAIVDSAVEGSIIVVGDRFSATSHAPRQGGYRQTVINWHAPTVLKEMQGFDEQMTNALRSAGLEPDESRTAAIGRLREMAAAAA